MRIRKEFAIDIDRLGVDWEQQRASIDRRRRMAPVRRFRFVPAYAAAAVLVLAIIGILSWPSSDRVPTVAVESESITVEQLFSNSYSTYIPDGLYVLNGFDDEGDFEGVIEFIVPGEGAEEAL